MPPLDDLGIANDMQSRREALVSRLSPAAKHAAFPKVYARPLPPPSDLSRLQSDNLRLNNLCRDLEIENHQLKRRLAKMVIEAEQYRTVSMSRVLVSPHAVSVSDVMRLFLAALERAGHKLDDTPYTAQDLIGPRRARASAWPRAIGMWLCRRLCKGASLPMIGHAFGGRDHTTVMHACARATHIMDVTPTLKAAALVVLAAFEESAGTEGAGRP